MSNKPQLEPLATSAFAKVYTDLHGGSDAKPEKPELSASDCEALQKEFDQIIARLCKWMDQLGSGDKVPFQPYLLCRNRIRAVLTEKRGELQDIQKELAQLERLFRECWALAIPARKLKEDKLRSDLREADKELSELNRLIEKKDMALTEARKNLKAKTDQIDIREKNVREKKVEAKKLEDYKLKTKEVTSEKDTLENTTIPDLEEALTELKLKVPSAKDKLAAVQKRLEPLETARLSWEKGLATRAAAVEDRIRVLVKDTEKPEGFQKPMSEVNGLIAKSGFIEVEWKLADLEKAVDDEDRMLRETFKDREGFIKLLLPYEIRVGKIEVSPFLREQDAETLMDFLEKSLSLAQAREYAQAGELLKKADIFAQEIETFIAKAAKAQPLYEEALLQAQALVDQYEADENALAKELGELNGLIVSTEEKADQMDFEGAMEFLGQKFTPIALKFIEGLKKWKTKVKKERRPAQPPNYELAANWIVDQVLQSFARRFDYAGGSVSLSNYPQERYLPGRLKRLVRARFANLEPHTALPSLGLSRACYFNLGSGGTTKSAIEYNVKVKLPGVMKALAQVHVVYH